MTIQKYVKLPIEIEAIQYHGQHDRDNVFEITTFTGGEFRTISDSGPNTAEVYDYLHRTWIGVKDGDYILKGSQGEFYPHDGPLFQKNYRKVD